MDHIKNVGFIDRWLGKEVVVYLYNEIPLGHKKG